MKKLVGYVRVSSKKQEATRNGLEAQMQAIQQFAAVMGYDLITIYEEAKSGALGKDDRPMLAAAMKLAEKEGAHIVVNKLDRLSRDAVFIMELMRSNVRFIVTELGEGVDNFALHVHAIVAEDERSRIASRTRAGMASAMARGVKMGNPTTEGIMAASKAGNAAISTNANAFAERLKPIVKGLRASGMTFANIAEQLNLSGIKTARGGKWEGTTVRNLTLRWKED